MAARAGATDWMPASSLWSFSAFSFSSIAICLSMRAQSGLTALMSRMVMAAQPARIRLTPGMRSRNRYTEEPPHPAILYPTLKLALDDMHEHLDPLIAVVEARDVAVLLAPMLEKDVLVLL